MSTYDNLNIAQATLIFDSNGNTSVGAGEFDLSTMAFLPNVPLIDQIEVERVFDTGADTKFGTNQFTIADRRQCFIFPKNWYSINEQTKILKFVDLATIPTKFEMAVNPAYYPLSRTFLLALPDANDNEQWINIPVVANTTAEGPPVRQYDKVFIRRKTISLNSIVTFAPGTRLTTTQLNLQFDQLKYLIQELVAKIRNEIILKYDENAVDGPFLGNTDLKMNNNFIKDVATKEITDANTPFTGQDNIVYTGGAFIPNVFAVKNAVTKGAIYRTGVVAGTSTFTGDFTTRLPDSATNYKITNLAPGTVSTDAVNLSQLNNADNLTSGTVGVARLPLNIPLANLSSAAGQTTYTLPLENLPNTLGTNIGTFGKSAPGNADNMVYATVNNKGILSGLGHRSMAVEDLPTVSGLVAQAYGGTGKLLSLTADAKGRITIIAANDIVNADLPLVSTLTAQVYGSTDASSPLTKFEVNSKGIITSASHRAIAVVDLPTTGVTQASTYGKATATNTNNMLQIAYDTTGRVTLASHRNMGHADLPDNIPLSKLSNALSQSYILPKDAIADGSILFAKLDTVTANQSALPLSFIPDGINLSKINPANAGQFVLPDACLNNTAVVPNAYSGSPIKDITVDAKGRITSISERAIGSGDIPALGASAISITTSPFADALIPPLVVSSQGSYGSTTTIPTFTVDTKGRVTVAANSVALSTAHIGDFNTNTNNLIDGRAISHAGGTFYNAGTKLISNVVNPVSDQDAATKKYVVDNFQSLSGFNTAAATQIQANAVFWDSANSRFTALRSSNDQNIFGVATPTVNNHAANKLYVDTTVANYQTTSGLAAAVLTPIQSNAVYWDGTNFTAFKSGENRKIRGVATPSDNSDAVPLGYFNTNALVAVGGVISAGNKILTGLGTPALNAAQATDAVNFGLLQSVVNTGTLIGSTVPQVYRLAVGAVAATPTIGSTTYNQYSYQFLDSSNPLMGTTSSMLLVEVEGSTIKFTPQPAAPTTSAFNGYFYLQDAGTTKTVHVYTTATLTGFITIRNFGLSRLVSGAAGTTSAQGIVSIVNNGGITVNAGAISLTTATDTQLGGVTIATNGGLTNTSGSISVTRSDSTTSTSTTILANSKAVNDLKGLSMLLDGTQQMTGKLRTATATTAIASLSIPSSAATLGTLVSGDLWNLNDVLQFRTTAATKQIAYRDAATTGALGLVQISTGNDSGLSITGPGVLSIAAASTTALGGIKIGTGLELSSGSTIVRLSSLLNSTLTDTAATSSAAKTIYDYAVGVQANLTATNTSLATTNSNVTTAQNTASAALPKAGGTMTGMIQLAGSTTTLSPLRFVGGTAPTSPTAGDVWFESNTLKMRIGVTTKDIAFTDSALSGTAATATKLANERAITLTGPITGSVNFDGSQAVSIATTVATNAIALGTNTTGDYIASATGTDGVSVTGSGGEGAGITISNTDKGSSQAIFKTITPSSGTSVTASSNTSVLNLNGSGNITVTGAGSTITIANTATAPLSFGTIAVTGTAGQTSVAADTSAATLTLNAGAGLSITTNAGTDVITLANTGVTGISGTTDQVIVGGSAATPTLSLPQSINTSSSPSFTGATFGSVRVASGAANTITTTGTNQALILDPNGTGEITLVGTVNCSTNTLTAGASTLGTLSCDAITFKTNGTKLQLGTTLSTVQATAGTVASVSNPGDIVFRVPASGKAFLITDSAAPPTAGVELITKTALDNAVSSAISGGGLMPTAGTVHTQAQTLGCSVGNFVVKTGTDTPTATRLTIVPSGAATFSGALTVTGGTSLDSTLVVTGATTLNNAVTIHSDYNVTAALGPTLGNHLANKTYVDGSFIANAGAATNAVISSNISTYNSWLRAATSMGFHAYKVRANLALAGGVPGNITTTAFVVGVPEYCPCSNPNLTNAVITINLVVQQGHVVVLLYKNSSAAGFLNDAYTTTNIYGSASPSFATIVGKRGVPATYSAFTIGTVFTSASGTTTYQLAYNPSVDNPHNHDFIFMRIA